MIPLDILNKNCVCQRFNSFPSECVNEFTFTDSGKTIQLKPKSGEKVILIAIDKCLIDKDRKKCDCMFIYKKSASKTITFLVELKGKNHIKSAFEQLSLTKEYEEYKNIISQLTNPSEKFVIVSDVQLNKIELNKLENEYNIRVRSIRFSEPQSPIPDLKNSL